MVVINTGDEDLVEHEFAERTARDWAPAHWSELPLTGSRTSTAPDPALTELGSP
jgi:hypothetical protein